MVVFVHQATWENIVKKVSVISIAIESSLILKIASNSLFVMSRFCRQLTAIFERPPKARCFILMI